jgi:uncharacterized protein YukE
MENNKITYSFDKMQETASKVGKELDQALSTHNQMVYTSTNDIGEILPKDISDIFSTHMHNWDQSIQTCYRALYKLADVLDKGSKGMDETDQIVNHSFNNK